ncbi:MAG: transcriptional repressor, partial [Pseudomonadota bacterium]
ECLQDAMDKAEKLCQQKEQRFTPIRRKVLEIIWSSHEPVSAYDLLRELRIHKKNAEAPTVYRALEFLQSNDLIHRIETLNSFVGCNHPETSHISQFLICEACNQVAELTEPGVHERIHARADELGFRINQQTVELIGICSACSNEK